MKAKKNQRGAFHTLSALEGEVEITEQVGKCSDVQAKKHDGQQWMGSPKRSGLQPCLLCATFIAIRSNEFRSLQCAVGGHVPVSLNKVKAFLSLAANHGWLGGCGVHSVFTPPSLYLLSATLLLLAPFGVALDTCGAPTVVGCWEGGRRSVVTGWGAVKAAAMQEDKNLGATPRPHCKKRRMCCGHVWILYWERHQKRLWAICTPLV